MTTTNDKLRSLFLAALMVFSVFAMTVALPGSAAANHSGVTYEVDGSSTNLVYAGQTVNATGLDQGVDYQLRSVDDTDSSSGDITDSSHERNYNSGSNGAITIETDDLGEGDYFLTTGGETVDISDSFEVTEQTLDVDFDDTNVTDEEENAEYELSSNRNNFAVNISADGDLSASELNATFNDEGNTAGFEASNIDEDDDEDRITVSGVTRGDYEANFSGVDAGQYTFDFEADDTTASSSASVNVSEAGDGDIQFEEDVVQDQVGDVADITLQMENTDEGTIVIGSSDQNYWLEANVEDGDNDGEVTVQFNSYTAGSGAPDDQKVWAEDDDDTVTFQKEGGSYTNADPAGDNMLGATEYDMNVTTGLNAEVTEADEVGALSLQERSTSNVTTWTAPAGTDFGDWDEGTIAAAAGSNLTQSEEVANTSDHSDFAVIQVESSGLEGAFASTNDDATLAFLNNGETSFEVERTNTGPNAPEETLNLAASNMTVVDDANNDTYYVAIDTGAVGNFDSDGAYEANFTVNAGSELNTNDDDPETETSSFEVIDGESSLDTNEDDLVLVEAADNQTVSGTSTWAPGTELEIRISSDDSTSPFLTRPEATVQPDGTLSVSTDFSDLSEGTNLTLELDRESDDWDGQVVAEGELGGETETETVTETVTETETDTETDTEAPDTDADTDEPDTETDTPTDDSGPGFTVVAALGALIAAALLAVRRNN